MEGETLASKATLNVDQRGIRQRYGMILDPTLTLDAPASITRLGGWGLL
jgi:hypothetical protein